MQKHEFIEKAQQAMLSTSERFISMTDMTAALNGLCAVAAAELLGGGEVPLPGLGKLKIKEKAAREGRNPRTGEVVSIPAGKKVVFVPGKNLKDALKDD